MYRVVLIGDSIRLHYQPFVRDRLAGEAEVAGPIENCETSRKIKTHLRRWLDSSEADVIHLNCGLHDIRVDHDAAGVQVPLAEYIENVDAIVREAQRSARVVILATSTPVNEELHRTNTLSRRSESDLRTYNRAAVDAASKAGAQINDLCQVVVSRGDASLWADDGVHFTEDGYQLLGNAVASRIRQVMTDAAGGTSIH